MILSRLDEVSRTSTSILNDEDDRMILSGLDEVFRTSTSILNDEDDGLGFARLTSGFLLITFGHR